MFDKSRTPIVIRKSHTSLASLDLCFQCCGPSHVDDGLTKEELTKCERRIASLSNEHVFLFEALTKMRDENEFRTYSPDIAVVDFPHLWSCR